MNRSIELSTTTVISTASTGRSSTGASMRGSSLQTPDDRFGWKVAARRPGRDRRPQVGAEGGQPGLDPGQAVADAGRDRLAGPLGVVAQATGPAAEPDGRLQLAEQEVPLLLGGGR